jgi:porphobilinogen synthase
MEKSTEHYINQRRLRANKHIRELATDVVLTHRDFIQPLFLDQSVSQRTPLSNLNGVNADTVDTLVEQIRSDIDAGVTKFLLFPVPSVKTDTDFNFSYFASSLTRLRNEFGSRIWLAADLCLCAYTAHGHCGILTDDAQHVLNKETVEVLSRYAVTLARAGADCIAPSDMMDGRIAGIRSALNEGGLDHVAIMSYSAKFSSQFYGPFRDACKSSPGSNASLKDRKTYQASAFYSGGGIAAAQRDEHEGADIIMVKPALPYLDVLTRLKSITEKPLAAYHVSGEYQSLEVLAEKGIVDRSKAHVEVWTSIRRAGASIIISYASRHARQWINEIEY